MTWLIRNYQFQRERRINLGEFGVAIFANKQEIGLVHDKNLARVLATISGICVTRKVDDPNTTIPELRIVDTRVPVEIIKPAVVVEKEGELPYVEPVTTFAPGVLVEIEQKVIEKDHVSDTFVPEEPEITVVVPPVEEVKDEIKNNVKDDPDLLPFCGCGCEKRVKTKGAKFLRGHHLRKPKSNSDDNKSIQN